MLYQSHNSVGKLYFECKRYNHFEWVTHMHKHLELIYVREGETVIRTGNKEERICAGEFAMILSHQVHAYYTPEHSVVDVIIFSVDQVPMVAQQVKDKVSDVTRFVCRKSVENFAASELFIPEQVPCLFFRKAALYAVCQEYLEQVTLQAIQANKNDDLLQQILEYISDHFRENITLNQMAEELGYEPHYLSRAFHNQIKTHFSRFVNWYRVEMATDLLQHTDLSMSEIAFRSGFQSIRNFNRVYAEHTGNPPAKDATRMLGRHQRERAERAATNKKKKDTLQEEEQE